MSLLELAHATKRFASGQREVPALDDVSFALDAGECVAVCGLRRSGRTTLLQVAAGLLPLDAGEARFDGHELAACAPRVLGIEIAYWTPRFDVAHGRTVREHVAVALLARGVGRRQARTRADAALERVGASAWAQRGPRELRADQLVRAGVARALVGAPRLLLLDEPTSGVEPAQRDRLLAVVRELADEGLGVLMTVGEPVAGASRALVLERGRLRGDAVPPQAPVVPLQERRVEPVA